MKKTPKIISPDDCSRILNSEKNTLLLDVLPGQRFQMKHLPGARNACVFEVNFPGQVGDLCADKNRPIVVYGVNDLTHDAKTAAEKLLREGYTQVSVLSGGLAAWQASGYPLEGDEVDSSDQPGTVITDGTYEVDTETSVIEWAGRNPNSTHWGTLRLSAGEVRIHEGQIKGEFKIDMHSIENVNLAGNELKPVLESHLKSDDFFFVKKFPQAVFELTARPTATGQPVSSPNYEVNGRLSLCGISAEQNFAATIIPNAEGQIVAEAHFDFDRTRWGVIYGSTRFFEHLGMHLVFDQISLQLRILTK
jgi:polyisoprenoid-binding protein YceI